MHKRTLKRLTLTLAMLSMAVFLLAACGSRSEAARGTAAVTQPAAATSAATATTAPTVTAKPSDTPQPTQPPTATTAPAPTSAIAAAGAKILQALKGGQPADTGKPDSSTITFAVIGDDGTHSAAEQKVAQMVTGWKPDFIVDTGDVYYTSAGGYTTDKYDRSVGDYYCDYVKDVTTTGTGCPHGNADINRFFPTLGNHDYSDASVANYLEYFNLPGRDFKSSSGNERYYDFTWGPVHFFSLNSNTVEPDGTSPDSKQGQWLKKALSESKSAWNVVFFHHPPYSSGVTHGDAVWMQWPFKDWGATAVFNGHEHLYERLQEGGLTYFVNGAGGGGLYDFKPTPEPGSQARVAGAWGAQKVTVTDKQITFEYYTDNGKLADTSTIQK